MNSQKKMRIVNSQTRILMTVAIIFSLEISF